MTEAIKTEAIKTEMIFDAMGAVLARWTMGSAAAPAASFWRTDLGDDPTEAELRLLALAGQFLGTSVLMEPSSALRILPDIPLLPLPTMPETLRPLARRILATKKQAKVKSDLVHFLAARGWTVHPSDWMPEADDDDVPDVYASWRDWAANAASSSVARQQTDDRLTTDNWGDFWPAARKVALAELRRRDPSAARAVLEARFAGETADARWRLLSLLSERLSDDDTSFLEGIAANDRAPKVKALATSLLSRLGRGPAAGEDAAELAGFFAVKTKGLLRRVRVVQAEPLKTAAQSLRRKALFDGIDLASFSGALGLAPQELIAAWDWGADQPADAALVELIAATGADEQVTQAADAVADHGATGLVISLAMRLVPAERARHAEAALNAQGIRFELAQLIAGTAARLQGPLSAPAGNALLAALRRDDAKPSDHAEELHALGLIVSREGARRSLEQLSGAGLLQGDPRLDMLRLNAALDDKGARS
ncbi:hypothetical protein CO669_31680 [Bradyrhizobium sp. Y36]|uniref:DUF5691 domain-containing protein n=1 Tax=Bradyrhizobium sp. Y36 TaxID=2035447 RepID=UPI000BE79CA1|nr:DUF5691 domain-containing protein [Bradyrhizobium sp. Y36]PDT85121.1 hypothetical protein CO669_31680 [Bradyrhizobium sp. Y36]